MKVKIALFGIFLLLWAAGCGKANVPQIDAYAWTMTTIQGGENGSAVACAPELADSHENAAALELTCKAENGRFILTAPPFKDTKNRLNNVQKQDKCGKQNK